MVVRKGVTEFKYTQKFLDSLFGDDLHAKRVHSLANATLGAMTSASLAVCTIGHGLALARGGLSKHAIKQVDRLLSNPGIDGVHELGAVHGGLTEKRRNRHGLDGLRCR